MIAAKKDIHKVDLTAITMRLALLLFLYIEFGVY